MPTEDYWRKKFEGLWGLVRDWITPELERGMHEVARGYAGGATPARRVATLTALDKMAVEAINPRSLGKVSDREVLNLHRHLHGIYANIKQADGETTKISPETIIGAHIFIMREMEKRGMEHSQHDELDEASAKLLTAKDEEIEKYHRGAFGSPAGKTYIAERIAALLPEHKTYVEGFAGGAAVFWNKPPSEREVLNDLDPEIADAYRFLKGMTAAEFEWLKAQDWEGKESLFNRLKESKPTTPKERFRRFYYLAYGWRITQGRFDPLKQVPNLDKLPLCAKRLRQVLIRNQDYKAILKEFDTSATVFYLDPPYPGRGICNRFDFSYEKLTEMVSILKSIKGKFLLTLGPEHEKYLPASWHTQRLKVQPSPFFSRPGLAYRFDLLAANFPLPDKIPMAKDLDPSDVHVPGILPGISIASFMVVPDYINLTGSIVEGKVGADLDFVIRQEKRDKSLEVAIRDAIDPQKEHSLTFIYHAAGPHDNFVPLWHLMAVPCQDIEVHEVAKAIPDNALEIFFVGTGAMNSPRRDASVLVSYGEHSVLIDAGPDIQPRHVPHKPEVILLTEEPEGAHARRLAKAWGIEAVAANYEADGLRIRRFAVKHTNYPVYGYEIEAAGKRVVYAPEFWEVPKQIEGADLAILEGSAWKRPIAFVGGVGGHAAILDTWPKVKDKAKAVIFTHVGKAVEEAIDKGEVKEAGIKLAKDGMVVRLSRKVEVEKLEAMKPAMAGITEAFSVDEVWPWVEKRLEQGIIAEPKWDGFRLLVEAAGGEVHFFSDVGKAYQIPALAEALKEHLDADYLLDGEMLLYQDGQRLDRPATPTFLAGKLKADPRVMLFDLLELEGEDWRDRPLEERRQRLEAMAKTLPDSFRLTPQKPVKDKAGLEAAFRWGREMDGSEGIMLKALDSPYTEGGSADWAKLKAVLELKVRVLAVNKKENGWTYEGGLLLGQEGFASEMHGGKAYINLGSTFITAEKLADVGDTLNVLVEELLVTGPEGERRLSWGKPKAQDVDRSRGPYTAKQVTDMARRGGYLKETIAKADEEEGEARAERATAYWQANWHEVWPLNGRGRFVLQAHWRGLDEEETKLDMADLLKTDHSLHFDLRLEGRGQELWGFTLFAGETSANNPTPRIFRLNGDKLQATPKLSQPDEWLLKAHAKPYIAAPDEAGATSEKWAKMFELDIGDYDLGVMRAHASEVFLHGNKLKGRHLLQYAPLGGERKWILSAPESQEPYAGANKLEDVLAELKAKRQKFLVWAQPGTRPVKYDVAAGQPFGIAKAAWAAIVPIVKVDLDKQLIYGVVLEPGKVDAHGDWEKPEEIERAAHEFLAKSRRIYLQHKERAPAVEVVESYIAPQDLHWDGQAVKAGSWVLVCKVNAEPIWRDIKAGKYTGYSIRGLAATA